MRLADTLGHRVAVENVGDDHLGSGRGQTLTESRTDAARAARDDCNFILEPHIHVLLPKSLQFAKHSLWLTVERVYLDESVETGAANFVRPSSRPRGS